MANLQSQIDILAKAIIRNFANDHRMVESFGGGIEEYNPFDVIYQNEYGNTLYDLSYLNENEEFIWYDSSIKEYTYQDVKKTLSKITNPDDTIELTPKDFTEESTDSVTIKDVGRTNYEDGGKTYKYYGKITFNGETKIVKFTDIDEYNSASLPSEITITELEKESEGWSGKIDNTDITISSIIYEDETTINKEWSNIITLTKDENKEEWNGRYIPIDKTVTSGELSNLDSELFKISISKDTKTSEYIVTYKTKPTAIPIPIHDQKYQTRLTNVGEKLKGVNFSSLSDKLHKYGPINTYDISCINVEGWNFMNKISVNEETIHNITNGELYTLFNQNNGVAIITDENNSGYELTFNDNGNNVSFIYDGNTINLLDIKTEDGSNWKTIFDTTYVAKDVDIIFNHNLHIISSLEGEYEVFINSELSGDGNMEVKNVEIEFLNKDNSNDSPFNNSDIISGDGELELRFEYNNNKYECTDNNTYVINSIKLPNEFSELTYNNNITISYNTNTEKYNLILHKSNNNVSIKSKIAATLSIPDTLGLQLEYIRHGFETMKSGVEHYLKNIISCEIKESGTSIPVYIHLAKKPLKEYTSSTEFYINNIEILSDNELIGNIDGQPVIINYSTTNMLNRIIAVGHIKCSNTTVKEHIQDYNISGSNEGSEDVTITINNIYIAEENRYPVFNTLPFDSTTKDSYKITTLTYDSINKCWKCDGTYNDGTTTPDNFTCYITSIVKQQQTSEDVTSTIKELTTTHKHKNYYFAEKEMAKFPCNHIIDKNGYIHTYYYPDEENNAFSERKNKYSHFNGLQERLFKNVKPSHQYNLVTGIFRSDAGSTGTEEQCFNYYVVKNLLQNVTGYIESNYGGIKSFNNVESRLLNLFTPINNENVYPSKDKFSEKSTSSLCMYVTNGTILNNNENTQSTA